MDLQEKYDELDNIIRNIDYAIEETTLPELKDYVEQLELIKYEAQNELQEIEEQLDKQQEVENRQLEREYILEAI